MPLHTLDGFVDSHLRNQTHEAYLIFYSSIVDGKMWCPSCRDVEGLVQKAFGLVDGPSASIIYVGDRAEWKSPSNKFRGEPWKVQDVPTIIRTRDGIEDARIVEKDIPGGLAAFLQG